MGRLYQPRFPSPSPAIWAAGGEPDISLQRSRPAPASRSYRYTSLVEASAYTTLGFVGWTASEIPWGEWVRGLKADLSRRGIDVLDYSSSLPQ